MKYSNYDDDDNDRGLSLPVIYTIIAMAGTTDIGIALISYIYESPLLIWVYENNFVLTLLMTFL